MSVIPTLYQKWSVFFQTPRNLNGIINWKSNRSTLPQVKKIARELDLISTLNARLEREKKSSSVHYSPIGELSVLKIGFSPASSEQSRETVFGYFNEEGDFVEVRQSRPTSRNSGPRAGGHHHKQHSIASSYSLKFSIAETPSHHYHFHHKQ